MGMEEAQDALIAAHETAFQMEDVQGVYDKAARRLCASVWCASDFLDELG